MALDIVLDLVMRLLGDVVPEERKAVFQNFRNVRQKRNNPLTVHGLARHRRRGRPGGRGPRVARAVLLDGGGVDGVGALEVGGGGAGAALAAVHAGCRGGGTWERGEIIGCILLNEV